MFIAFPIFAFIIRLVYYICNKRNILIPHSLFNLLDINIARTPTLGNFFLGALSQAKIRVCKTCVSRDFSDLRQLTAICYKHIGYLYKLLQITINTQATYANCCKLLKLRLTQVLQTLIFGYNNAPKKNPNTITTKH